MKRSITPLLAIAIAIMIPVAAFSMSQKEEIDLGRKAVMELRPQGIVQEKPLTQVGSALKERAARKDLPWQFWVLEDEKQLNAFALPGGFVFITRAYYERLDIDELAFVIGHEMAHVDKKHFEQTMKRARQAQMYDILAGVIIGATKAGRGWGTAADMGTAAFYTKYSRKLEKEADLGGYELSKGAGFDVHHGVTALEKLGKDKSDPITSNVFATHPMLSGREERLSEISKNDPPPAHRPNILKNAVPKWKYSYPSRDELKNRLGVAVRVVGEDGEPWENKWREDFRNILFEQIELAGKYDVRSESRADGRDGPNLSDLKNKDNTDKLLVITVHEIKSEPAGNTSKGEQDYQSTMDFTARLIDTSTEAAQTLKDYKLVRQEAAPLPVDKDRLFLDMTITQMLASTAKEIAAKISAP